MKMIAQERALEEDVDQDVDAEDADETAARSGSSELVENGAHADGEPGWGAGAALVQAGRLDAHALRKIVEAHERTGVSFVEIAARLGLVERNDLQVALAIERGLLRADAMGAPIPPALIGVHRPNSALTEHFRAVRTNLVTMRNADKLGLTAIASLERRREADFFALNLAAAFAELGKTVLLVDADLRAQRLERLFGLDGGATLRDVLRGAAPPLAAVRETVVANLDVVPAGRPGADAQEALSRPALREVLNAYAARYDHVMALSSPFEGVADGRFVWAACGQAIIAVRQHEDRVDQLRRLHKALRQVGAEATAAVLVR
ncbi:MAG: hypothetical protein ACFB00_07675 [Parvularculaceae bacterium]